MLTDKAHCTGCSACASVCPKRCISMETDADGFWYPKVERKDCVNCGLCGKVCPVLHRSAQKHTPAAYAAYCKNEELQGNSSSGGLFTAFAEKVIDHGGVVFGARFDYKFHVVHSFTETKSELEKFRGSKYVQSKIGCTYGQTRDFLERNRLVYFSGTPCQICGLKAYLGKDYENLICQDLICHGVPSPKVWEKYVAFREAEAGASARRISFRHKRCGWKRFSLSFVFLNGKEYCQTLDKDPYLCIFLNNTDLRPSCYNCAFKMPYGKSDITLADYWGIQNVDTEMFDDKGVSLVMIHTEKGKALFSEAAKEAVFKEEDPQQALRFNPGAYQPATLPANRRTFFDRLDTENFEALVSKYAAVPLHKKLERAVKNRAKIILKQIGLYNEVRKRL